LPVDQSNPGQEATVLTTPSTHRTTIVAALACALLAIAAPVAAAQSDEMQAGGGTVAVLDSRPAPSSFAEAAAKAQQKQDLRSPDARDAGVKKTTTAPLPGPPTWPLNPEPLQPPSVVQASDDGGLDWTTIGLGFGGSLLVLGGIVGAVLHGRRVARGQVAA
jgi:hypothetical protein